MAMINLKTPIASKSLCIFCYRSSNQNICNASQESTSSLNDLAANPTEKLQTCDKFYHQLQHPPLPYNGKKNRVTANEQNDTEERYTASWNPEKTSICGDCFYAVKTHARLFEKLAKLQRRLRWQIDKLYNVMKSANKLPFRVQDFREHLKGDKDEESVVQFRQAVFQTCRKKLKSGANKSKDFADGEESASDITHVKAGNIDNDAASKGTPSQFAACSLAESDNESVESRQVIQNATIQTKENSVPGVLSTATPALSTIFKCSKCSSKFPSLETLTSHAKDKHWIIKEEPYNSNDDEVHEEMVVECTVEITTGSRKEQLDLDKLLESNNHDADESPSNSGYFSFSDSDPEVRKNAPALRKIIKSLRPHIYNENDKELPENLHQDKVPSRGPMKRKVLIPTPKGSKKTRKCSVICEICGKGFTGQTMTIAESQLFKHMKQTNLHDGKATWKHVCKICNKLCRYESTMQNHLSKAHATHDKRKRFSCSHCKMRFLRNKNLISHCDKMHPDKIKVTTMRKKERNSNINENRQKEPEGYDADMSAAGELEPKLEPVVVEPI